MQSPHAAVSKGRQNEHLTKKKKKKKKICAQKFEITEQIKGN
jgi:hypothetical protein